MFWSTWERYIFGNNIEMEKPKKNRNIHKLKKQNKTYLTTCRIYSQVIDKFEVYSPIHTKGVAAKVYNFRENVKAN